MKEYCDGVIYVSTFVSMKDGARIEFAIWRGHYVRVLSGGPHNDTRWVWGPTEQISNADMLIFCAECNQHMLALAKCYYTENTETATTMLLPYHATNTAAKALLTAENQGNTLVFQSAPYGMGWLVRVPVHIRWAAELLGFVEWV